jgi:hypothetical protein
MKMADILRTLADKLDHISDDTSSQAELTPVNHETTDDTEVTVMVPPLQAKLEILKKSEGIPSVYDEQGTDELETIKKNAGLSPCQQEAAEDNDMLG